ncbi:hypothetical protein HYV83_02940 [Candidatus Woesearchaeota archaeon]|nr:hypothetical protein [Candidatus Woesearchaeota archaeon]
MEAQLLYLDAILSAYNGAGYAVWEFQQNQAVKSLINGDRLQWLKARRQVEPSSLETIAAQPPVMVLKPGMEYVALPRDFGQKDGNTNGNGKGSSMAIEHCEIRFSASNFVVGTESIFVMNMLTQVPEELSFSKYYDALAKLQLAVHEEKQRRVKNGLQNTRSR